MNEYPEVRLKQFSQTDGPLVSHWLMDDVYAGYFRNNAMQPSYEECCNYPTWANNIIYMVVNHNGDAIGMASAYEVNFRNQTVKAGLLIDKAFHKAGYGHSAQVVWLDFLFRRLGFRKVQVENIDQYLTEPYKKTGFFVEGTNKRQCEVNGKWVDEIVMGCFKKDWKGKEAYLMKEMR